MDKVSDPKLKAAAGELLSLLAEAVGPQFVATQLHKKAVLHKSPKVVSPVTLVSALQLNYRGCAELPNNAVMCAGLYRSCLVVSGAGRDAGLDRDCSR